MKSFSEGADVLRVLTGIEDFVSECPDQHHANAFHLRTSGWRPIKGFPIKGGIIGRGVVDQTERNVGGSDQYLHLEEVLR